MKANVLKNCRNAAIGILFLSAFSCGGSKTSADLTETTWKLKTMMAPDGVEVTVEENLPTLIFGDSMKLSGYSGCNYFFGSYTASAQGRLVMNVTGSTMRLCPDSQIEEMFLRNVARIGKYEVLQDTLLYLSDSTGVKLCTFIKKQ